MSGIEGIGARLSWALDREGLSYRRAAKKLEKAGFGGTYGTLWAVVNKTDPPVSPSLDLVWGIAKTFGVNPLWLSFGVGRHDDPWPDERLDPNVVERAAPDMPVAVRRELESLALTVRARQIGKSGEDLEATFATLEDTIQWLAALLRLPFQTRLFHPPADGLAWYGYAKPLMDSLIPLLRDEIDLSAGDSTLEAVLTLAGPPQEPATGA